MDRRRSLSYLRAKKKVETLKGFYSHLLVFVIINTGIVLFLSNVFGPGQTDFGDLGNYFTVFFWGIGLLSHGIYVLFVLYGRNNFIRRWEEKKIREFLEEDLK